MSARPGGGGVTRIGADCLIMGGAHVAHDCQVGDRVILVNNCGLAGHVQVGDDAIVGGLAGVHQWVRIGQGAMIGGLAKVVRDVIPYGLVDGPAGRLEGLNLVGLKRRGAQRAEIAALRGGVRAAGRRRGQLCRAGRDAARGQQRARRRAARLRRRRHRPPFSDAAGMIALFAGTGALPGVIAARLIASGTPPLICALDGFPPQVPPGLTRLDFRLETLGTLVDRLRASGVDRLCMAGAIRRPAIDPARIDDATRPLVPRIGKALASGDDGALREVIAILEERGIAIVAADELAPDLLPLEGVPTAAAPTAAHRAAAALGEATVAAMGARDQGQACLVRDRTVLAEEGPDGTDAMLAAARDAAGAVLVKAPKPGQDRRADLPVIGPDTAAAAVRLGLAGIAIEASGVMVLAPDEVIGRLDAAGLFLWVRPRGAR